MAVGKASSAVDNQQQYRPQESPANSNIQDRAGDAGGTLRGSSGKTNAVVFSEGQPHRVEVLKAASSAFVAEEQALADVGPDQGTASFQNGFYAHRGQSDRASGSRPGCELLLPLPQLILSAATKEGVAAERNPTNQPYCSRYTFPPTKASTVGRSSCFHVASPIHALVSPR